MQEFNLYREAKDHYDLLVPDKLEGLILLSLFDKYSNEEFNEERISDAIDQVYKDLGRQSQRNEYDRNNTIILKFQEFFLWRDEIKKTYRFKAYGEEFCLKIKERLESRYSPAEIKRLFDSLYYELLRHLETPDLSFSMWHNEHFKKRTTDISSQVEILDQQVSESVREFRTKIKDNDLKLFQLLEEIEISLDEIKEYANQLKESFKSTYDIEYKLEDLILDTSYQEFIAEINDVMNFNAHIRGQLEQVSIRIDKIKPRVREFIYDFNQRDFDRKTVLFLNLLINKSVQTKNEKGKKILLLPEGVPEFQIYNSIAPPKFVIIPDRDITPKIPVELVRYAINKDRQEERIKIEQQKLLERKRVQFWFKHVIQELEKKSQVEYSTLFYEILKHEGSNLSITIKLTSKIIRELSNHKNYKIIVEQEETTNVLFNRIKLWKMQIQKI
jgi:hypothetical protein